MYIKIPGVALCCLLLFACSNSNPTIHSIQVDITPTGFEQSETFQCPNKNITPKPIAILEKDTVILFECTEDNNTPITLFFWNIQTHQLRGPTSIPTPNAMRREDFTVFLTPDGSWKIYVLFRESSGGQKWQYQKGTISASMVMMSPLMTSSIPADTEALWLLPNSSHVIFDRAAADTGRYGISNLETSSSQYLTTSANPTWASLLRDPTSKVVFFPSSSPDNYHLWIFTSPNLSPVIARFLIGKTNISMGAAPARIISDQTDILLSLELGEFKNYQMDTTYLKNPGKLLLFLVPNWKNLPPCNPDRVSLLEIDPNTGSVLKKEINFIRYGLSTDFGGPFCTRFGLPRIFPMADESNFAFSLPVATVNSNLVFIPMGGHIYQQKMEQSSAIFSFAPFSVDPRKKRISQAMWVNPDTIITLQEPKTATIWHWPIDLDAVPYATHIYSSASRNGYFTANKLGTHQILLLSDGFNTLIIDPAGQSPANGTHLILGDKTSLPIYAIAQPAVVAPSGSLLSLFTVTTERDLVQCIQQSTVFPYFFQCKRKDIGIGIAPILNHTFRDHIALSPLEDALAYGGEEGKITVVLQIAGPERSRSKNVHIIQQGLTGYVNHVLWSPNGHWIFGADDQGNAVLLGTVTRKVLQHQLLENQSPVIGVSWVDNDTFVTIQKNGRLSIWSPWSGVPHQTKDLGSAWSSTSFIQTPKGVASLLLSEDQLSMRRVFFNRE